MDRETYRAYLDEDVFAWFHEHRGPRSLGKILDDPQIHLEGTGFENIDYRNDREGREKVNAFRNEVINSVMRLVTAGALRFQENQFDGTYEWVACEGCGSPGPRAECDPECDWGECPGPDCGFRGHLGEHVQDQGSSSGFTGAPIYWVDYACGHQDVDASADTLEAAR